MKFSAEYWVKNVFGCHELAEQHASAYSSKTAAQLFDAGMKIFRGDAATDNALKVTFADGVCVCIYREIKDMENGVYRVRTWTRANSYDEAAMSKAALKKLMLSKFAAEFAEPAEQSA